MRGKSSSRTRNMEVMERPTSTKHKEEPHLSGAYIRSLVKQLSSSRLKDHAAGTPNSPPGSSLVDESRPLQCLPPPLPQQPKKQVRRRLHTSRPYQERLLNMAEARREIVTALKFHRAAMKQANEQQQQQHHHPPVPPPLSCPNPNPNYLHGFPGYTQIPTLTPLQYPSLSWPCPTIAPVLNISDLPLPNQPLGLNLNIQGFSNIKNPPMIQLPISPPSSSSSYSISSPPSMSMEVPTMALGCCDQAGMNSDALKLHQAMDEKEMAEIRMIGEKHDMEWNDTVNLVTSAWWSNFLETMEGDDRYHVLEGSREIPAWLGDCSGEDVSGSHLLMEHLDDYYLEDASLPCLDIGEIEGFEGEWLS